MECGVITVKELLEGNKRICLRPIRAFKKCYKCPEYERTYKDRKGEITTKICESRIITKEGQEKIKRLQELMKKKRKILSELKKINADLTIS